eukprot:scaffold12111_cov19-Prasinocladus_malaysianus.AAC.1
MTDCAKFVRSNCEQHIGPGGRTVRFDKTVTGRRTYRRAHRAGLRFAEGSPAGPASPHQEAP